MEPNEVQKRAALGKIPLSFDMNESEVTSLHRPPTFYAMAPRLSYLPIVSRSARESFEEAAPDVGESGVWFEHEGEALRWNIPIGTLYDYHSKKNEELPFKITIRFQGFPKTNLLPCAGEVDVENAFFHSMKQALCLRFGSAKRLMEMPKINQENLWDGIVFAKYEKYLQSCHTLLLQEDVNLKSQAPIRVIIRDDLLLEQEGTRVLQASVPYLDSLTLKDAIDLIAKHNGKELDWDNIKIYIQGVSPSLEAPIKEICEEMCAHDLFLYVIVRYDRAK